MEDRNEDYAVLIPPPESSYLELLAVWMWAQVQGQVSLVKWKVANITF